MFIFCFRENQPKEKTDTNSKSLLDVLEILGEKFKVKFSLSLSSDFLIKNFNLENISLEEFLKYLYEEFHLHCTREENRIFIKACENTWKTYDLNFFNVSSFGDQEKQKEIINNFWKEVEKELQSFKVEFTLSQHTGFVRVLGNCQQHKNVEQYIAHCVDTILQKIKIHCEVIEVIYEKNKETNVMKFIEKIISVNSEDNNSTVKNKFDYANLPEKFLQSINYLQEKNNNVSAKSITSVYSECFHKIPLLISSTKTVGVPKDKIKTNKFNSEKIVDYEQCTEGFDLNITPVILLKSKKILFKISLSITNFESSYKKQIPDTKSRTLKTSFSMDNKKNESIVLCGLDNNSIKSQYTFSNKIINFLFGKTEFIEMQSKIFIIITIMDKEKKNRKEIIKKN